MWFAVRVLLSVLVSVLLPCLCEDPSTEGLREDSEGKYPMLVTVSKEQGGNHVPS